MAKHMKKKKFDNKSHHRNAIKTIMSDHILIRITKKKYLTPPIFVKGVEQIKLSSTAGRHIK